MEFTNRDPLQREPDPATPDAKDREQASLDAILEKAWTAKSDPLALLREEPAAVESVAVVPKQADEFICKTCFMVRHKSQLANTAKQLCRECA